MNPALDRNNTSGHCCEELAEHRTEQREDVREIWHAINGVRWQIGLIFGGLAVLAVEIPIVVHFLK